MSYSKHKRKNEVGHADDWLMTYADLITLLLCFFAIVVISEIPKKKQTSPPVPQNVEQVETISPVSPPVQVATVSFLPRDFPVNDEMQSEPAKEVAPDPNIAIIAAQDAALAATQSELDQAKAQLAEALKIQTPPAPLQPQGDRIKMFEMNSAAFFASGSAVLSEQGKEILRKVAVDLRSDPYKDYEITVEGHTDDTPIHTAQFPSNWELSTARASAVVQYFLEQGIAAPRLRAAGYADTFPKASNRDANGNPIPANRAENRRVVIELEKIEKN